MPSLLTELQALETELHHPGATCDLARLDQLLHAEFHEIGRSGRPYDRRIVLDFLSGQPAPPSVVSDQFSVCLLAADIALLTYRSAQHHTDGSLSNHSLRSSLWVKTGCGWQLRYHQGTPAAEAW